MDKGHHVLLALLDQSAVFDTVDHGILLERLSMSFSVRDGVLDCAVELSHRAVLYCQTSKYRVYETRVYLRCPSGLGAWPSAVCFIRGRPWKNCRRTWRHAHFYADDSQLYMSAKPQRTDDLAAQLLGCMEATQQIV